MAALCSCLFSLRRSVYPLSSRANGNIMQIATRSTLIAAAPALLGGVCSSKSLRLPARGGSISAPIHFVYRSICSLLRWRFTPNHHYFDVNRNSAPLYMDIRILHLRPQAASLVRSAETGTLVPEKERPPRDPPKMTERTQFPPAPTVISACVAYKWRPLNCLSPRPKIGFVSRKTSQDAPLAAPLLAGEGFGVRAAPLRMPNHEKQKNERTNPIPGNFINGMMLRGNSIVSSGLADAKRRRVAPPSASLGVGIYPFAARKVRPNPATARPARRTDE